MKELSTKKEVRTFDGTTSYNNRIDDEINTFQRYKNYIPIDYLKCELVNFNTSLLLNNQTLSFSRLVNEETGEIIEQLSKNGIPKSPCRKAIFRNLVFMHYPESNRTFLLGSLHALSNNGIHNYNDFPLNKFIGVLKALKSLFGIEPHQMRIIQLEWGLNIEPPFDTNSLIDHCLMHKWKRFEFKYDSKKGKYKQVEKENYYILKLYNKGLHFKLPKDLLRFERKQLNWSKYCAQNQIGNTLNDLMQSDFKGLRETLLSNWEEILFFDPLISPENNLITAYRDPFKWKFNNRTTRKKHFDKLKDWNVSLGGNIQGKTLHSFINKLDTLNSTMLTNSYFTYTGKTSIKKTELKVKRFCKLTRLNISMQRCDSSLLSHTGLRYYQEHNPKTFLEIKNKYLSKHWIKADEVTQIKEIAHNIRTRHNNIENKQRDLYYLECRQYNLFTQSTNRILVEHYGLIGQEQFI